MTLEKKNKKILVKYLAAQLELKDRFCFEENTRKWGVGIFFHSHSSMKVFSYFGDK